MLRRILPALPVGRTFRHLHTQSVVLRASTVVDVAFTEAKAPAVATEVSPVVVPAYVRGVASAADGDLEAAMQCFQEALGADAGFVPASVGLGQAALSNGDIGGAHTLLLGAHKGFAEFQGSHPAAADLEDAGIDLDSTAASMHVALADVYRNWGDTLKQTTHLELAIQVKPDDLSARLALGDLYTRGRQYEKARAQFGAVLDLHEDHPPACTGMKNVYLGEAMELSGRSDAHGALTAYRNALDYFPEDEAAGPGAVVQRAEIAYLMGQLYESVGDGDAAMARYLSTARGDPRHWRCRMALGGLCQKQAIAQQNASLVDDAMNWYKDALSLEACKEQDRAHYAIGQLHALRQEKDRAAQSLRTAVELNPQLKEARVELANVLLADGNTGGAIHHLEAALEVDPQYAAALHNLKQIKALQAAKGEGDAPLEGTLDVSKLPSHVRDALMTAAQAEMLGHKGDIEGALRQYDAALPTVEAASEEHPQLKEALAAAYTTEGLLLQRSGRAAEAITRLQLGFDTIVALESVRTAQLPAHVFGALISALIAGNDSAAAEELCTDALTMPVFASTPVPMFMMGTLNIFKGDLDGALEQFQAALEVDSAHVPSLFNVGNVYLRKHTMDGDAGNLVAAADACRAAIAADEKAAHAHLFLGDALLRQGKDKEGLEAVHTALRLDPNFGGAHSLLGAHLATREDFEAAIPHLRTSIQQGEQSLPEVRERDHTALIMCFMRQGKTGDALQVCKDLVALMPGTQQYQQLMKHLEGLQ